MVTTEILGSKTQGQLKGRGPTSPSTSVADPGIFMCLESPGLPCLWPHLLLSHFIRPSHTGPITSKIPRGSGVGPCHSTLCFFTRSSTWDPSASFKSWNHISFWAAQFKVPPEKKTPFLVFPLGERSEMLRLLKNNLGLFILGGMRNRYTWVNSGHNCWHSINTPFCLSLQTFWTLCGIWIVLFSD